MSDQACPGCGLAEELDTSIAACQSENEYLRLVALEAAAKLARARLGIGMSSATEWTQGRVVGRSVVHAVKPLALGTYPMFTAQCGRNLGMDVIEIIPSDGIATTCKPCLSRQEASS